FSSFGYLLFLTSAALVLAPRWTYRRPGARIIRVLSSLAAATFAAACAFAVSELANEISYRDVPHYGKEPPEVTGVGPITQRLIGILKSTTRPSGRVLFETSRARVHDDGHVAGYIAFESEREFIGGPYTQHLSANFVDGTFMHQP